MNNKQLDFIPIVMNIALTCEFANYPLTRFKEGSLCFSCGVEKNFAHFTLKIIRSFLTSFDTENKYKTLYLHNVVNYTICYNCLENLRIIPIPEKVERLKAAFISNLKSVSQRNY